MWQSQGPHHHHQQQQQQQQGMGLPPAYPNNPQHNGVHHNMAYNNHNGQSPGTPNANGNHTWVG